MPKVSSTVLSKSTKTRTRGGKKKAFEKQHTVERIDCLEIFDLLEQYAELCEEHAEDDEGTFDDEFEAWSEEVRELVGLPDSWDDRRIKAYIESESFLELTYNSLHQK